MEAYSGRLQDFPEDEQAAFASACRRHAFVPEEFEVSARRTGSATGVHADHAEVLAREISVARVVGAGSRIYVGRSGSSWIRAFEQDLERDEFGFPLGD